MVHLSSYLGPTTIALGVEASDKDAVLRQASACMASVVPGHSADDIAELLRARERVASTGIGDGIAIPHATCATLAAPRLGLLRLARPVEFDAVDRLPVQLVVVVLAPPNAHALHLRLLARIARLLGSDSVRAGLLAASTAEQAYSWIGESEAKVP